jgi:hypothetical protein
VLLAIDQAAQAAQMTAQQQQAAQQISVAQQDRQRACLRLVKKYRAQGMRPDPGPLPPIDQATESPVRYQFPIAGNQTWTPRAGRSTAAG